MKNKEDPLKRIEDLIEKHQHVPGRLEDLLHDIADKLAIRVGTYEKISFSSNHFEEALLNKAYDILVKFNQLKISFQKSGWDRDGSSWPTELTIRFKDRQ